VREGLQFAYLIANHATKSLLGGANGLVVLAGHAVGVVGGGTRGSDSGAGEFGSSLRGIVLGVSLVLLGIAVDLVRGVASHAANSRLDGTSGSVDVRLESRGLVAVSRHLV
jgi:hypothetical protein